MRNTKSQQVIKTTIVRLFLMALTVTGGQAWAQVFFLQGEDGQDGQNGTCASCNTITGDVNISGKLTVQGGYDFGDCPSGYEVDPAADPSIIVCVHPASGDEMVKVGDSWVDRYEATVFDNPDCTGTPLGSTADDWAARAPGFPHNGNWSAKHYACSVPGHIPTRWVTWFMAQAACAAQGKHLITNAEWQVVAEGTYDPGSYNGAGGGACHTNGTGPRQAGMAGTVPGGTTSCISRWGAEDMIANLWEFVSDWYGQGANANDGSMTSTEYGQDGYWNVDPAEYQVVAGVYFPAIGQRGGYLTQGTQAGVFAVNFNSAPTDWGNDMGFRCARTR